MCRFVPPLFIVLFGIYLFRLNVGTRVLCVLVIADLLLIEAMHIHGEAMLYPCRRPLFKASY